MARDAQGNFYIDSAEGAAAAAGGREMDEYGKAFDAGPSRNPGRYRKYMQRGRKEAATRRAYEQEGQRINKSAPRRKAQRDEKRTR